ncbi:hypothetical protein HMPREF9078_02351 [Capnocytophaga sp. oral taxon 380 str. F0488]|nr:hypothetical protein HMPREF9078_02351 [Capnocytophaga sp. oral taxon 380 str. F0488]
MSHFKIRFFSVAKIKKSVHLANTFHKKKYLLILKTYELKS